MHTDACGFNTLILDIHGEPLVHYTNQCEELPMEEQIILSKGFWQINENNLEKINQKDNWIWIIETSGPKPNSTYGKNCMDYHKH